MSAERTVAKNAAWLSLQPLVMNVLSLAATGFLARKLGSSEFGRFGLAYAFVAMFVPLANMGLRALTIRHVAQNRESAREYLGKVLVLRTLLATACAALIMAAAPLSGGSSGTQAVIAVAAVGMILTTVGGVFTDGYQAFERMPPASLANLAGALLLTVVSVIVVAAGGGIREMALAYALGPLCSLLLLWWGARRQPFCPRLSWDVPAFRDLLRQGAPFFAIALLDVVSVRLDVLVLARVMGEANLGSYTVATSLVDRGMILCDGAATALLPAIAHMTATSPAAAVPLLRKATLWLLLVTLPIALLTTALSPLIVHVIFGAQYAAAAAILAVAIWRLPAMCMAMLAGHSLFAVKRQDLALRTGGIAMAVSIALIYPMVRLFGPMGGAIALVARPVLTFLLRAPAMGRYFPRMWPWGQLARMGAGLCLMAAPLMFARHLHFGLELIALVLVSGLVYLLSLGVMGVGPVRELAHQAYRRLRRTPPHPAPEAIGTTTVTRRESVTVSTEAISRGLPATGPRVLLFGGDGGDRNLGDQAMLINSVARIRRTLPGASITVLARTPDRLPDLGDVRRARWPEDVLTPAKIQASCRIPGLRRLWRVRGLIRGLRFVRAARALRRTGSLPAGLSPAAAELLTRLNEADLVVNYGSGGLNDIWDRVIVYPWSFCYLAAHALGNRVVVTGQGIGPLSHWLDRRLLCSALNRVDAITVRDCRDSMELLRGGGVRAPLRVAADDALSLQPAPQVIARKALEDEGVPPARPLVALQFRDTAFDRAVGDRDRGVMAAIADCLIEETGGHVVFVSTVYNEVHGVDDRAAAEAVVKQMKHAAQVTILQGIYDPPTVKSIIAEADLAIGTSYHFQIFALATRRPTLCLYKGPYYRQKANGLFGHFERTDSIFDLESCSIDAVVRQALASIESREQLSERADAVIRRLNAALDDTWRDVAGWFVSERAVAQVEAGAASEPSLVAP